MLKSVVLTVVLLFAVTACGTSKSSASQNGKPLYLFVIISNYGKIQHASDGSYQLILNHADIEKILAFSNRPARLVKHITGEQLSQLWIDGETSFSKDPPNATVIINQHLQTVVLYKMDIVEEQTIFTIRADGPQNLYEITGKTQVFLDGFPVDFPPLDVESQDECSKSNVKKDK